MGSRNALLSIAAGLLTPVPLFLFLSLLQTPALASRTPLGAAFLFAWGIALCPPVHPLLYGAALPPGFALAFLVASGAGRSGNLFGFALIIVLGFGILLGAAVALCGWAARRWNLPRWAPAVPIVAACLLAVFGQANAMRQADAQIADVAKFLQKIGAAEQDYAAGRPDHAYTCNGPDLFAIAGIEWRTDYNFGGPDRNQGKYGDFWITLRCPPKRFRATAQALWPGGPRFALDSQTGAVAIF